MHTKIIGEIYRSDAGILLLSRVDIRFAQIAEQYRQQLRSAGKQFATVGKIDSQTTEKLKAQLIEPDEYVKYANKLWDQILPDRTFAVAAATSVEQGDKVKIHK